MVRRRGELSLPIIEGNQTNPRLLSILVEVLRSLEEGLLNFAGCAFVVSHDRFMLDRIATHILACEGDSKWFWFPGNYAEYEQNRLERLGETSIKRITYAPLVNA